MKNEEFGERDSLIPHSSFLISLDLVDDFHQLFTQPDGVTL